jgi:hypothetical protein
MLIFVIPVAFSVTLWRVLRPFRQGAADAQSTDFQQRTAFITALFSLGFGAALGWGMWWLSRNGPGDAQVSYRGNGALEVLLSLAISMALAALVAFRQRARLAALVTFVTQPLAFSVTYVLITRFA